MNQAKSHHYKSIFLLFLFLFLKLGIVHAVEHAFNQEDTNDCEECVVFVETNKINPFTGNIISFSVDEPKTEFTKTTNLIYQAPDFSLNQNLFLFNRPPPFNI